MYSHKFEPREPRLADPEIFVDAMRRAHRLRAEAMIELWRQLFAKVGRPDIGRAGEANDVHTHLPPTG